MNDIWSHPQLEARKRWTTVDSPVGPLPALQPPGMGPDRPARIDAVPALGAHTDAILVELGYGERIAALRAEGNNRTRAAGDLRCAAEPWIMAGPLEV